MNSLQLLTGPVAQALGWALLHLVWQATIVAGILAAVLALMSRQSASARYVVSCSALALVFAMFVGTAIRAYDPAAAPIALSGDTAAATSATMRISLEQLPVILAESAAEGLKDRALLAAASARNHLPSIVAIWLAGVVLLSARLLVSWVRAKRLIHRESKPASREWQRVAAHLSNALGLRRAVTLLESAAVEVPSVIGSLRPIVLLPASALTGMTPEQIEMVLAHEMAHIRRHDFLVNLLQALVETLMFYHPAVWWMSRRVRIERENCCDDLAVAVCGNPIQYARALTRLEELRANALPVVVAANGGSLLERIRRIAAGRAEGTTSSSRWAVAVAMLVILGIAAAVPSLPALAERQEQEPQKAESKVDVVEARAHEDDDEDYADVDVDVDVDIDRDMNVDVDPDIDLDLDLDLDLDPVIAPEPPDFPETPFVVPAPRPALAPLAIPAPVVPPVPPAPVAVVAGMDFDFDYDDDDDDRENDRELGSGGKLSVDELISLRATGVTPAYVNQMRAIFPGLTLKQVTSLSALGVDEAFIKEMRSAGFEVKTAKEATSLKAVGVTPAYVREMKAAGFDVSSAKAITSMRAVGVTPEFVREMKSLGFDMSRGKDATSLSAVGVTASWVREMRAAGVKIESVKDATSLRAMGVTAEFVKKLAAAGYTNLSVKELTRLAAAGVDDDFIRDMEQYRKK